MFKKYIIFVMLIIAAVTANAQIFSVKGTVMDSVTKQKLAFVNIIINDDVTLGTSTDIDGTFSIQSKKAIETLTFSYVGYKKKQISVQDLSIKIYLSPVSYQLQEVVFKAGENPAHRIIDSVVKNRKHNNPEMLDYYQYTIYDRMVFTVDTTEVADSVFADFGKLWRDNDLMVMETVSDIFHKKTQHQQTRDQSQQDIGTEKPNVFLRYRRDAKHPFL